MPQRNPIRLKVLRTFAATLLVFAAAAAVSGATAQTDRLEGTAEVLDGLTLVVGGQAIRLSGIDGPDPQQTCRWSGRTIRCGLIAGDALRDLVSGAVVRCTVTGRIAGRSVGTCQADGFDIGGNMIHAGWALAAPEGPQRYRDTEAKARAARRGLWRGEFVHPAEWRAGARLP